MVKVPTVWWGYSNIGYYLLNLGYCLFGGVTPYLVGELLVWWGTLSCVGVSLFLLSSTLVLVEVSLV